MTSARPGDFLTEAGLLWDVPVTEELVKKVAKSIEEKGTKLGKKDETEWTDRTFLVRIVRQNCNTIFKTLFTNLYTTMGQQLFKVDFQSIDLNDAQLNSADISSDNEQENIHFLFPNETDETTTSDAENLFIDKIREHLFRLTHSNELGKIHAEINYILSNEVYPFLKDYYKKVIEQLKLSLENQHQLHTSLSNKFKQDEDENQPVVDESIEDDVEQQSDIDNKQIPYFAIQSLASILLLLIKSVEKTDPAIIQQIVTLTSQLCEQLPIGVSSALFDSILLFQSLQPVRDFFHELSLRNDPIIATRATKILLKLSIAQCSFKEILPLLARLIFDTETIYDVRRLFIQLNKILTAMIKLQEQQNNTKTIGEAIEFLKSIGLYPNTQLMQLNKNLFTGQFIASVILTHIDISQIHASQQLNHDLAQNPFAFEFHPKTFEILFNIITQLTTVLKENSNSAIVYMLTVCLRLFTTHLKYLSVIQLNLYRDLLATNDTIRKILPQSSQKTFDLSKFVTEEQLINWFELLLDLSHGQERISEEASKAFICLLDLRMPSFTEKLSFMHRSIVENKRPILINQLIIELNKNETLLCWIGILSNENNNQTGKNTALKILESFIEICFNPPEQIGKQQITQIEKMLFLFQHLLVCQLLLPTGDDSIDRSTDVPSSVAIQYLTYLFRHYSRMTESILFNSALVGLCLMTKTNELFDFMAVQPIFVAILPLLADYMLQSLTKENFISNHQGLFSWLIGKMTFVLISGSLLDSLETKHMEKLQLTIFTGGYENSTSEKSAYLSNLLDSNLSKYSQFKLKNDTEDLASDEEFLMSVFNNSGEGAGLITKMKMFIKERQHPLQPSIEEQANDLVAVMYAVYIKHFDRINLAKLEAVQTNRQHTHSQLLSIFEYANYARTILRTIKAEGGICDEFYQQVKKNALFLLLSIGKSDSIPMVTEDTPSPVIELPPTRPHQFQRQVSRWSKAKYVLKLLRHLMQACIRFKRLMRKKQARQKRVDAESLLSRAIDQFIYKEKDLELDELKKCLFRQYERAITRLITYRFIEKFMQNVAQLTNQPRVLMILTILLPMLRKSKLEWSYFENISAVDLQLRQAIRISYNSIFDTILPSLLISKSNISMKILFNHLNFDYTSAALLSLSHYQFPQKLFPLVDAHSVRTKFLAYNWFRLFTVNLCQNIQLDQTKGKFQPILEQQRDLLFRSFIQCQLEPIQTSKVEEEQEHLLDSFKDLAYSWFHHLFTRGSPTEISSRFEKNLWINQYLLFLLRCFHFYAHVRPICATIPFIELLLNIYDQSGSKVTRLLSLKILRQLIPYLQNYINDGSKDLMEKFFIEILHSIGTSFSSQQLPVELVTELIYLYRTVVSRWSPWQLMAINFIFNSITSHLNLTSLQSNDTLVASLCVLGGYIDHVGLSSIVRVATDQEMNDESRVAMIMEMNSDNAGSSSCSIQYIDENQIQPLTIDRLQVVVQVPPPNLLSIPTVNVSIDSVLDAFGHFLQLSPIVTESLKFLQFKRRSVSALYHLLQDHKMVEIFMSQPYTSLIAQLSMSESLTTPTDLTYFDKKLLEQYSLRLDMYQRSKSMINNYEDSTSQSEQNYSDHRSIVAAVSTPISKYNGWKPFASKTEIQMWKQGQIGNGKIKLIPFPITAAKPEVFETCGQNHQFKGRIFLKEEYIHGRFPTFTVENVQLTEGKWYFCVKLPTTDVIQIGWATKGFTPKCDNGIGIGDDEYSWCYDGSRGVFFNNGIYRKQFNDIRWKNNDVCGCGIDIDGNNTNIKYWLNGKLLGTAFKHQENIPQSNKKCNLFPHGQATTFFPGVTLQYQASPTNYCEMIFSPEDMQQCPLPAGYKPLLLPTLVHTENSLVAYPSHTYVVGDNPTEYLYTSRTMPSTSLLRDFVNEDHLATDFQINLHGLSLPKDSDGFPLTIEKDTSSFTVAYDLQLSQTVNEMQTITLVMTHNFSIQIPLTKLNQITRVLMIGNINEQQIKVYWDNQSQTFQTPFSNETTNPLTLYYLPKITAVMQNIAVWNYALPEDHIHRLFTYGLCYIATDYQQLQEHRKQMNTFSFIDKQFSDEFLIPFDQPFNEDIWQAKKKQADQDEGKYFSREEPSTIELVGNKTYLVLEKSIESWSEYTIILDVSIVNWPIHGKEWSLVTLNDISRISVTHEGKLCLKSGSTKKESDLTLNLNEYYRLWIIVKETSCQIFTNGQLQIDIKAKDARFVAESNRFYLFQEKDVSKKISHENTLRIRCQSITLLNRSTTIDEHMKTPSCSLQSLVAPPLSIIAPSLIAIGHQPEWIEYVIEQYNTTKALVIDRILREQKEQLEKNALENQKKRLLQILSTLNPTIDQDKFNNLISTWKSFSHDQVADVGRLMLTDWNDLEQTELTDQQNERFHDLDSELDLKKWIHDLSTIKAEVNGVTQVGNRNRRNTEQSSSSSSSDDEEPDDDDSSSFSSDHRNRQRVNSDSADEVIVYRLHDLAQEQREELISLVNQQKATEYTQEDISSKGYTQLRIRCEQNLITIYARDTLLNMFKIWSNQSTTLFPLDKFGDWTFVVKLFRIMFYHYASIKENIDDMSLLILSLLKVEIKQILEQNLENKAPLLCALQKDIFGQIIQFLMEPSSLNENLKFVWKVLNLCVELIKDKSTMKQNQIDILLPHVFPVPMINLIFKLFLSVKTHQSKIFILHLFSNLIQISNSFKLNAQMEHFLFTLLRELPSNESGMKLLRLSVMDVVVLLKEQDPESQRVQLPGNVRDLFTTIDIINALTDPTKQTVVPEQFFTKSEALLGDGMQFNRNAFIRSNCYFDRIADFQLLDFMNKSQELKKSFAEFIRTLPTESVPNSTFYQNHPSLSSIPADCVLIRTKVLYQLQLHIINALSLVDCSLSPGESFLTDQIQKAKMYLLSSKKRQLLDQSVLATESGYNRGNLHVHFDVLKAAVSNENYENTMFYQAYQQLYDKAQDSFRKKDKQLWKAQYINMHSTDEGGPYRDSITQICSDVCSTRLPLFILCPNGRTNSASNQDCWIPNVFPPNKSILEKLQKQYRFVGQLMGLAIRKKHYLNVKFAPLLWKELLYDPITIVDIQAIDSQSFTLIHEVEQQIERARLIDTDNRINYIFNSILTDLHFEVVSSAQQTFELVPNGSQIPITAENFKEYSFHYRQYRLNEFHRQIDYIRQGLHSVVPCYYLNLFTADELEEAVCGKGHIDVELLKRNTIYRHGYNQNSPLIERFWKVMSEMFTEEQKKMLLVFAWGRSTLPVRNKDFSSKFTICKYRVEGNNVDQALPQSHTCSFTIDLPEYSTVEIMHERLNYAITHCSSIDGDGHINVANVNHNDDSSNDDYSDDDE